MLQPVTRPQFYISSRVIAVDPDTGDERKGTVQEIHPATGALRIEFDGKWMHDWLSPEAVQAAYDNVGDFVAILCEGQYSRPTEETLTLGTPVRVTTTGTEGVVSGHNPNDVDRVRVSWFDRTDWIVRHKFYDRGVIEVMESKTAHQG